MDDNRFNMMMKSIKKPCVLRLKLIKNKKPGKILFVYEGDDDYDFYHHALTLSGFDKEHSHINGSGKDQSVSLYKELEEEKNENLNKTYFFVDQDYSIFSHHNENITTLPFYAIENPLSEARVIKHFIVSTFKFDERHGKILDKIMEDYSQAKDDFYSKIKNLSIQLYMSRILGLGIEFPSNSDVFEKIERNKVILKQTEVAAISERLLNMTPDEQIYYDAIMKLDKDQLTRGKYVYHFVSEWLMRIKKYIHSRIDNINDIGEPVDAIANDKPLVKVQYDHTDLSIAKLVTACLRIQQLDSFIQRI